MDKKLFIGNLSYNTTEESLRELFSQAGTVESAVIIVDKFTGRSKGFGFVEFSSPEEAQEAIRLFNEKELDGRPIAVTIARPKEDRPRDGGGRGGFGGGGSRGGFNRGGDRGGFSRGGDRGGYQDDRF